jgi:hypothetical protein
MITVMMVMTTAMSGARCGMARMTTTSLILLMKVDGRAKT